MDYIISFYNKYLNRIFTKFSLLIVLLVIIIVTVLSWTTITRETKLLEIKLKTKSQSFSTTLSKQAKNALLSYDLTALDAIVKEITDPEVAYAYIISQDGLVMAGMDSGNIVINGTIAIGELVLDDDITKKALQSATLLRQRFSKSGEDFLDVSKPIIVVEESGATTKYGVLRLGYSLEPLKKAISNIYKTNIIVGITFVILGIIISIFMANMIAVPINKMMQAMQSAEDGDLTLRVNIKSGDERGKLGNSYNKMMDNLSELVTKSLKSSEILGTLSDKLASNSKISENNIDKIGDISNEINKGANENAVISEQVNSSINQLSSSAKSIARLAREVLNKSKEMDISANRGNISVTKTLTTITDIRTEVQTTEQVINDLALVAGEIKKITKTMGNIIRKINTLAYNVSISAVRAGGEAKEITIIARQVRELGKTSSQAAVEIDGLIETISEHVNRTVVAIKNSINQVELGYKQSQLSGDRLKEIVDSVKKVNERLIEVVEDVNTQSSQTSEMTVAINNVAEIAKQTSEGTQHASVSLKEEMKIVKDVAALAEKLYQESERQRKSMNQFKVKER